MAHAEVRAGVCGFTTRITATSEDGQAVKLSIQPQCPNIKPLEGELTEVDGFAECFSKLGESSIYQISKKYCKHPGCPVPSALIKAVEVACGIALPVDVEMKIEA
jgi:hypothetical protein